MSRLSRLFAWMTPYQLGLWTGFQAGLLFCIALTLLGSTKP